MDSALTILAAYAARLLPAGRGMEPVAIVIPRDIVASSDLPEVPRSFSRIVSVRAPKKRFILITRAITGEVFAAKLVAQARLAGQATSEKKAASSQRNATLPRPREKRQ